MTAGLSYHLVVRALEGGLTRANGPAFGELVHHIVDGHLPAQRNYAAGIAAARRVTPASVLESRVRTLFALDLNPLSNLSRQLTSTTRYIECWNAYNAQSHLPIVSRVARNGRLQRRVNEQFRTQVPLIDVAPSRDTVLCLLDVAVDWVRRNAERVPGSAATGQRTVSDIARVLGLESTIALDASLFFEANAMASATDLARGLGCQRRTMERQLRQLGTTAGELRKAVALTAATSKLRTGASLTRIAAEAGFSDLAHFSRSFWQATRVAPSVLREMACRPVV